METEMLSRHTWIVPVNFEEAWSIWAKALGETVPPPKRIVTVADAFAAAQIAQRGGGIWMGQSFNHFPNLSVLAGQLLPAHAFHAFVPEQSLHIGVRCGDTNLDKSKFFAWFFDKIWNVPTLRDTWLAYQKITKQLTAMRPKYAAIAGHEDKNRSRKLQASS